MKLKVLGSRGSFPVFGEENNIYGHDTSCYAIKNGEKALIIDCGSGLCNATAYLKDCTSIDVVLSHVHYDHIMGLFENAEFFKERDTHFYGSFSTWIMDQNGNKEKGSLYRIEEIACGEKHDVKKNLLYELGSGFIVSFRDSIHPNHTSMIDIWKDKKHICFTGDYEHKAESDIAMWAKDCDLLLFDGSYSEDDYFKFMGWGHSKFEDGCKIAKEANVKKLLITHFSPSYKDELLKKNEAIAKEIFENTYFARQDEEYEI